MRQFILILSFCAAGFFIYAQNGKDIITQLQTIHRAINADSAAAISHRAMNVFLADKTGYLSGSRDLSFFTNYVSFNSSEGKFTVNHNFQQPVKSNDEPIQHLLSIGFDMTLASSYTKSFLDKRFENEMGLTVNYKWLGKVKSRFAAGASPQNNITQKQKMDALRAVMLETFSMEIRQKETDFITALLKLDSISAAAKNIATENFYADLKQAYEEKFAVQEAELLTKTMNFSLISTHWTSLTAYIPLLFPSYKAATSLLAPFSSKHPYPLAVMLGHTRLWETAKKGRLFFTLEATLLFNNSKLGYGLSKMSTSEYKSLGGTAIQPGNDPGNDKLYIGPYKNFITPSVSTRLVYFPSTSHVGLSVGAEKSFGSYDLLNCRLGIPIVLINTKKTPAVTIDCYVLFFDLTHTSPSIGSTAAGLSIGIPFSRLMY